MTHRLTVKEMRMLAELERAMDAGTQPYVVHRGDRWAMDALTMEEFGLVSGQTVSGPMIMTILEARLATVTTQIAVEKCLITSPTAD